MASTQRGRARSNPQEPGAPAGPGGAQAPNYAEPGGSETGEPPGTPTYYGEGGGSPDEPVAEGGSGVGDPPGSPAYYGEGTEAPGGEADPGGSGPGDPPGSPAYYGGEGTAGASTGPQSRPDLSLPTVGEAPGGPGYLGEGYEEPPAGGAGSGAPW